MRSFIEPRRVLISFTDFGDIAREANLVDLPNRRRILALPLMVEVVDDWKPGQRSIVLWFGIKTNVNLPRGLVSSVPLIVVPPASRESRYCIPNTSLRALEVVFHIPYTGVRGHAEQPL